MADALVRYGPAQPGTGGSTLITAGGAGTYIVLRHIHVINTSGSAAWITMGIGGVTAALSLWYQASIPAGDYLDWTGNIPLLGSASTPDTLQYLQQTASALTVTVGAVSGP